MAFSRRQTRFGTQIRAQSQEGAVTCARQLPVDVSMQPDRLIVRAQLGDFPADDVDVQINDQYLVISTSRSTENTPNQSVTNNTYQGNWYRRVRLPRPVVPEQATVTYQNGELSIDLPRRGTQTTSLDSLPGGQVFDHAEIPLRGSADVVPPSPGPHDTVFRP